MSLSTLGLKWKGKRVIRGNRRNGTNATVKAGVTRYRRRTVARELQRLNRDQDVASSHDCDVMVPRRETLGCVW